MRRRISIAVVFLLALSFAACAKYTQTLVVTGQTLTATGEQFLAANKQIEDLKVAGKVTDQQYASWISFKAKFKVTWREAKRLWDIADKARQTDTPPDLLSLTLQLKNELVNFLVTFYGTSSLEVMPI